MVQDKTSRRKRAKEKVWKTYIDTETHPFVHIGIPEKRKMKAIIYTQKTSEVKKKKSLD